MHVRSIRRGVWPPCGVPFCTGHFDVSLNALNSVPIPIPSLLEQKRIAGVLDEAFEGIAVAKANAAKNLQNVRALFMDHIRAVLSKIWNTSKNQRNRLQQHLHGAKGLLRPAQIKQEIPERRRSLYRNRIVRHPGFCVKMWSFAFRGTSVSSGQTPKQTAAGSITCCCRHRYSRRLLKGQRVLRRRPYH